MLRPRVIVDYEREPWILDAGTVRITFDMNVRAAVDGFDVFDRGLPTLPVLEPGKLVMEVKFTEFLPQIVRDILPGKAQEITAASKYVLCYDKASYLRGFDYRGRPKTDGRKRAAENIGNRRKRNNRTIAKEKAKP